VISERPADASSPYVFLVGGRRVRRFQPLHMLPWCGFSLAPVLVPGFARRGSRRRHSDTHTRAKCGKQACES
jgi:hypothetical protein